MKKREEMLRDLHRRMDEYESERRMKRAKVTKVAASVTPVCAAAVVGVGLWKGGALTPHNDQLIASTVESTASDVILSADNDTSADKHSANNNNADRNGEPTTSESTTDRQVATSKATIPRTTENGENVIEDSGADNASVEANTPVADDKSSPVSDNNENTNNESQRATDSPAVQTEAPVQQTTPPVQQTEPATQSNPAEQTVPNNGGRFMWCIVGSTIELNGFTYYDNDMANVSAYTRDRYIGKVGDFEGVYGGADVHSNYRIAPEDSVYAVKGTNDVLLVVKADSNSPYGAIIVMSNSNWSLEKYEPERLDPNYVDPNASSQVIF
jgi:hypothetical protein